MTRYREHARLMAAALRDANYQTGGLTDNARTVLARRYLKKDDRGQPTETPDDMFRRVAHDLAQAEPDPQQRPEAEARFYDLMTSGWFLPNSPTLMNAGRDLQQLSACFVLPVDDSLDSIFRTLRHRLRLQQTAPRRRPRRHHSRRGLRPGQLHRTVRPRHRSDQTGRHPPGSQYGHPALRPPRNPQIHQPQKRRPASAKLQHQRGRHRPVHGRRRQWRGLRPHPPGIGRRDRTAERPPGAGTNQPVRLADRRPRPGLHRPHQRYAPQRAYRPHRRHQPVRPRRHLGNDR